MRRIRSFFIPMLLLCLAACKEDVRNTYSNYPAYFVYKNVSTVPQLNAALNSPGIFTTIRLDRERVLFSDARGHTTPVNLTAIAGNSSLQMGIAGFITGLPNMPEPGSSILTPVCFDLACPNCYSAYNIERKLDLKEGGYASCKACERGYNLNNQGLVSSGQEGHSLFRYRITYSGNTVAVNNR